MEDQPNFELEPEPVVEPEPEVVEVQPEPEVVEEEPEVQPEPELEDIVAEVIEITMFDNVIVQPPVAPVEVRQPTNQPVQLAVEPTLMPLFGRRSARRNPGMRLHM